ncbi:MAG TPA: PAN domain-containing protein [Xanthobacteraceae bacterium]|nr:PAN domain-containing protein [Xanthobacteraceae bacterium]
MARIDWKSAAMIRTLSIGACCLALVAIAVLGARAQSGINRYGGDYARFVVNSGDPEQCAARCEREQRCRAWTFSYPRTAGANAICFLKSTVTPRVEDPCCISGVKGGSVVEPHNDQFEYAIDRFGGDYREFDLASDPSGRSCKAACEGEDRCRTWTYVRPGYLGPSARCYLKDRITPPRRKPCCISGVVR